MAKQNFECCLHEPASFVIDQKFRDSDVGHQSPVLESVDDRMISLMRLILALSALLITFIDPSEPDRLVAVTYASLLVYSVYGAILYYLSFRGGPRLPLTISHWIDIGCFLVLVALSSGTNSIFFFFFFFAILVASFRLGFKTGLRVTIVSTIFFTLIGYITSTESVFQLNRFLLRPVYLLVLGYMIAYWGGYEIKLKRRLNLLKEINLLANPRFGVSETIGALLEQLRAFYGADNCWLIISDEGVEAPRLFRLSKSQTAKAVAGESLPPRLAQYLLAPPADVGILYQRAAETGLFHREMVYAVDSRQKIECSSDLKAVRTGFAPTGKLASGIFDANPHAGGAGGTVNLSATLTDGSSPVSGKTVNFTLNGNSVGSGVTNGSGVATLNNASLAGINAGSHPTGVGASFAGDDPYLSSSTTNSLTVNKADPVISVTGYSVQYDGNPHTATGSATGVNGESLAGLDLSGTTHTDASNYGGDAWTFTDVTGNYNDASGTVDDAISKAPSTTTVNCPASVLYSGAPLTPCTATATGVGGLNASLTVTYSNNVNPGTATANASYAGDSNHNGSSGSATFTITALRVNFVIGDLNAVVGQKVTFWGSKWSKGNSLSGGATPSSFKGFATATTPSPSSCGGTWTSIAGDTGPPSTIPIFVTIMVSSSTTKNGSTISGNITKLVIIQVDPGYVADPEVSGTGTVYSVVCP